MLIAIFPLVLFIVGVLIYFTVNNPKWLELGKAMMWIGLFFLTFALMGHHVKIG